MKIPISVVHLKGAKLDGKGPLYLTGYGSYGFPYDISFNSDLFSMVDRGVVCAVAHIRGGGEMGKAWHDDGRMMHKKNTFTDFIASAEYLVAQGYGSKDRLVIAGAKRRRPADGCGSEYSSGFVSCRAGRCSVRGRHEHHAGRDLFR